MDTDQFLNESKKTIGNHFSLLRLFIVFPVCMHDLNLKGRAPEHNLSAIKKNSQ